MKDQQRNRPGNLLLKMTLNLFAGAMAAGVTTALTFMVAEIIRRGNLFDVREGLSLFSLVVIITIMYSLPGVLVLILGGEYIARRVPIIPTKGVAFVLLLGVTGLGLALLASLFMMWSLSFGINDDLRGITMLSAGIGGIVAGVVVAMRIGGKKNG